MKDKNFEKAMKQFTKVLENQKKAAAHKKKIARNFSKSQEEILAVIQGKEPLKKTAG